jgi:hypothetical protein
MATANKIFIQIDNDKIELIGADKEAFEADIEQMREATALLETVATAKKQARIDAITKLGQASGLTTEEIESILNI